LLDCCESISRSPYIRNPDGKTSKELVAEDMEVVKYILGKIDNIIANEDAKYGRDEMLVLNHFHLEWLKAYLLEEGRQVFDRLNSTHSKDGEILYRPDLAIIDHILWIIKSRTISLNR
jgi:hypothetical protein